MKTTCQCGANMTNEAALTHWDDVYGSVLWCPECGRLATHVFEDKSRDVEERIEFKVPASVKRANDASDLTSRAAEANRSKVKP